MNIELFFKTLAELYAQQTNTVVSSIKVYEKDTQHAV